MKTQPRKSVPSKLKDVQHWMARAILRPLTSDDRMQPRWTDGSPTEDAAARVIKPNDRMNSMERLEIYNRQYWFRVIDSFYEDFPGVRAVLGDTRFAELTQQYLEACPSRSYTLRNLGSRLVDYLEKHPRWGEKRQALLCDVARFEWAQIEAFDAAEHPPLSTDNLATLDPSRPVIGLQPFVQLLSLEHAVDDFLIALKHRELFRTEASNAVTAHRKTRAKNIPLPRKKAVCVAIHRMQFRIYYKRLDPAGFEILSAIRKGKSITQACVAAARHHSAKNLNAKIQDYFRSWAQLGWFYKRGSKDTP